MFFKHLTRVALPRSTKQASKRFCVGKNGSTAAEAWEKGAVSSPSEPLCVVEEAALLVQRGASRRNHVSPSNSNFFFSESRVKEAPGSFTDVFRCQLCGETVLETVGHSLQLPSYDVCFWPVLLRSLSASSRGVPFASSTGGMWWEGKAEEAKERQGESSLWDSLRRRIPDSAMWGFGRAPAHGLHPPRHQCETEWREISRVKNACKSLSPASAALSSIDWEECVHRVTELKPEAWGDYIEKMLHTLPFVVEERQSRPVSYLKRWHDILFRLTRNTYFNPSRRKEGVEVDSAAAVESSRSSASDALLLRCDAALQQVLQLFYEEWSTTAVGPALVCAYPPRVVYLKPREGDSTGSPSSLLVYTTRLPVMVWRKLLQCYREHGGLGLQLSTRLFEQCIIQEEAQAALLAAGVRAAAGISDALIKEAPEWSSLLTRHLYTGNDSSLPAQTTVDDAHVFTALLLEPDVWEYYLSAAGKREYQPWNKALHENTAVAGNSRESLAWKDACAHASFAFPRLLALYQPAPLSVFHAIHKKKLSKWRQHSGSGTGDRFQAEVSAGLNCLERALTIVFNTAVHLLSDDKEGTRCLELLFVAHGALLRFVAGHSDTSASAAVVLSALAGAAQNGSAAQPVIPSPRGAGLKEACALKPVMLSSTSTAREARASELTGFINVWGRTLQRCGYHAVTDKLNRFALRCFPGFVDCLSVNTYVEALRLELSTLLRTPPAVSLLPSPERRMWSECFFSSQLLLRFPLYRASHRLSCGYSATRFWQYSWTDVKFQPLTGEESLGLSVECVKSSSVCQPVLPATSAAFFHPSRVGREAIRFALLTLHHRALDTIQAYTTEKLYRAHHMVTTSSIKTIDGATASLRAWAEDMARGLGLGVAQLEPVWKQAAETRIGGREDKPLLESESSWVCGCGWKNSMNTQVCALCVLTSLQPFTWTCRVCAASPTTEGLQGVKSLAMPFCAECGCMHPSLRGCAEQASTSIVLLPLPSTADREAISSLTVLERGQKAVEHTQLARCRDAFSAEAAIMAQERAFTLVLEERGALLCRSTQEEQVTLETVSHRLWQSTPYHLTTQPSSASSNICNLLESHCGNALYVPPASLKGWIPQADSRVVVCYDCGASAALASDQSGAALLQHLPTLLPVELFFCALCEAFTFVDYDEGSKVTRSTGDNLRRSPVCAHCHVGCHSPRVLEEELGQENDSSSSIPAATLQEAKAEQTLLQSCLSSFVLSYFTWVCGCGATNAPFHLHCWRCSLVFFHKREWGTLEESEPEVLPPSEVRKGVACYTCPECRAEHKASSFSLQGCSGCGAAHPLWMEAHQRRGCTISHSVDQCVPSSTNSVPKVEEYHAVEDDDVRVYEGNALPKRVMQAKRLNEVEAALLKAAADDSADWLRDVCSRPTRTEGVPKSTVDCHVKGNKMDAATKNRKKERAVLPSAMSMDELALRLTS